MVWDKIREALFEDKRKRRRRNIAKGVAGSAAVAGLIATAKKMHEKGYDEKAVEFLKDSADTLKKEAKKLEEKVKQRRKPSPSEMKELKKSVPRKTKKEIKKFARDEYGISLSTNDLKDEMIDQFFKELKKR